MADDTVPFLQSLVPEPVAPVRVPPAPVRRLGPLAALVAWGSGQVLGTEPAHIFRVLGRHPRLFRAWLHYSGRLMPGGTLPRADAELVILRVAYRTNAAYEWHQHVILGLRAGLTSDEIQNAAGHSLGVYTSRRRVLLQATDELLAGARLADRTWTELCHHLDQRRAIELCLLVGQYQGLATALGGLGVQIEGRSPTLRRSRSGEHRRSAAITRRE